MKSYLEGIKLVLAAVSAWVRRHTWSLAGGGVLAILVVSAAPCLMVLAARGEIYAAATVPQHDVAIVFGAGVDTSGIPTSFLESRLLASIQLYRTGKVKVLVMSGDNRTSHYNEPVAMKRYVVAHGVPTSAVVLDYAGYDTYDTCYRIRNLFSVHSAILVTHSYHLPRALATCNVLGIQSVGVKADRTSSGVSKNYLMREVISMDKAGVQLIFKPHPAVLGPKEDAVTAALAQTVR